MAAVGYTSGDPDKVNKAGDTMTGELVLPDDSPAASQLYVAQHAGGGDGGDGSVVSVNDQIPDELGNITLAAADVGADTAGSATTAQAAAIAASAQRANNLSDLANAATARSNLGLGTAATHPAGDFDSAGAAAAAIAASAQRASNLSDLANAGTARSNLGLGTGATHDVPASGDATSTQLVLGNDSRLTAVFAQEDDPGDVADGSIWYVTTDIPDGYPNASNTGVPPGTVLTLRDSDMNVTEDNAVIDGLLFDGASIHIRAHGVTVQNCRFINWSTFALTQDTEPQTDIGTLIQDSDFGPPAFDPDDPTHAFGATQILNANFVARRLKMWGCENAFSIDFTATVEDCYVASLNLKGDPHSDCIQTSDSVHDVTIRHNTLISMGLNDDGDLVNGTSCIIMPQADTDPTNVVIHDNVLAGGGFAVYGPQNGTATGVEITDNKFWTKYFATCGSFGPWTDAIDEDVVTGNVLWPANTPIP